MIEVVFDDWDGGRKVTHNSVPEINQKLLFQLIFLNLHLIYDNFRKLKIDSKRNFS